MRPRRLPDGGTTTSGKAYSEKWIALGKAVEPYFPGYVLCSFDPGLVFSCHTPRPYSSELRLSVAQANLLIASATPNITRKIRRHG